MSAFGDAITFWRIDLGLSQGELARRINISQSYMSDLESGQRNPPSDKILTSIVDALDAPRSYFFYLAGRVPPELRNLNTDATAVELAWVTFARIAESEVP